MNLNFRILFILFVIFGFYFFSCSGSQNKAPGAIKEGKYNFMLSDSMENKISDGELTIQFGKAGKIFGKYTITKQYVEKINGISGSKGNFEGTVNDTLQTIFINMNPRIADSNMFINAKANGDSLNGDWNFSTLFGIQQKGKFKAGFVE
jgi:hypothetical protein